MDEDGLPHPFGDSPHIVESGIVQEHVTDPAVDHDPGKAESDRAFEFSSRSRRVRQRQGGHCTEPSRMITNHGSHRVIGIPAHGNGIRGAKALRAGRSQREDLHVDALSRHHGRASGAEVGETSRAIAVLVECEALIHVCRREGPQGLVNTAEGPVLFDADELHHASASPCCASIGSTRRRR